MEAVEAQGPAGQIGRSLAVWPGGKGPGLCIATAGVRDVDRDILEQLRALSEVPGCLAETLSPRALGNLGRQSRPSAPR